MPSKEWRFQKGRLTFDSNTVDIAFDGVNPQDHSYPVVGDRIKDVKTAVRSACKRAGFTGVTFRTLRHTCASWLGQMSGVEAGPVTSQQCHHDGSIHAQ